MAAYLGEIRMMASEVIPGGWLPCNGQLLPITSYTALFSLIGTKFGGDGVRRFALPNLQGRITIHRGGEFAIGTSGGEETHALTIAEMPSHAHHLMACRIAGDTKSAAGALLAESAEGSIYSAGTRSKDPGGRGRDSKDDSPDRGKEGGALMVPMAEGAIAPAGKGEPHDNMQPFLVVSFIICYKGGLFPSATSERPEAANG